MKFIVYLTTNTKDSIEGNNRIYIGVHKTKDPSIFDGYLGCGVYANLPSSYMYPKTAFLYAVKKYGPQAFIRTVLFVYDTSEEAYAKEKELVNEDFINQSHVYNMILGGSNTFYKTLYQFDLDGNLIKEWKYSKEAYDFYGYSPSKFYFAIFGKYAFLNSYWSFTKNIILSEYANRKWGDPKVVYLYNKQGKLLREFSSCKECAEFVGIKDITKALRLEQLIQGSYYVSYKLVDLFIPKARPSLIELLFYVYKDNSLICKCVGKELMNVIQLHSWQKIRDIFRYNHNWYKDFYISFEEIQEVPEKSFKMKVDVYDKYGNFIETLPTIKEVKEKYKVPSAKIKNIQQGNRYFGDYIFKYHSK